jgi:hypothetical protein
MSLRSTAASSAKSPLPVPYRRFGDIAMSVPYRCLFVSRGCFWGCWGALGLASGVGAGSGSKVGVGSGK